MSSIVSAQVAKVDHRNLHERAVVVVPIVGSGTYADPKRPAIIPAEFSQGQSRDILSFEWQPSDDGKYAIVEVATRTKAVCGR